MPRTTHLIIGAGLFGSVIAAALRRRGDQVLVVADQREGMGSRPAACLMKPSWLTSLPKEQRDPSLGLLDQLYGLETLRFNVGLKGLLPAHADVHWVNPANVLRQPDVRGTMISFSSAANGWNVVVQADEQRRTISTRNLILALGIWQNDHQPSSWPALRPLHGMALLLPHEHRQEPFIRPWAPYRQLVAFNRGDGLWVGDGSAIRGHKWTPGHEEIIEARCLKAVWPVADATRQRLHGIRPYAEDKPCLLRNPQPGLWMASGGAKNGTIAAGWCAHTIAGATR